MEMNPFALANHVRANYPRLWEAAGKDVPGDYRLLESANFMAEKIGFRNVLPHEAIEGTLKKMEKHLGGMGE